MKTTYIRSHNLKTEKSWRSSLIYFDRFQENSAKNLLDVGQFSSDKFLKFLNVKLGFNQLPTFPIASV